MTNQAFLTHTFKADKGSYAGTDSLANRHMPERLNDIINVKDWGATGDGSTDDTDAIQAAVDYAWDLATVSYRPHGTIVFFPAGTYRIDTGPLNVHSTVSFGGGGYHLSLKGAGMDVSILRGLYDDGFLVQKLSTGAGSGAKWGNLSDLTIWNESTAAGSGAFLMESHGGINYADNVHFKGVNGFWWLHDIYAFSFSSSKFTSSIDANSAASATYWPPRGSVGVWAASGDMTNCRIEGFDVGINLVGSGGAVYGCSITKCNVGIYTGLINALASGVNPQGDGLRIMSNRIERCGYGMFAFNGPATFTSSNVIVGTDGVRNAAAMTLSWSSDLVTATVAGGHNLQVNEVQRLAVTPEATAGTFTLTFGGNTTSAIAYNADAATVQTALRALASIGASGVTCSEGPFPRPIYIEFTGALGAASQSNITVSSSVTGGTATITQERNGGTTVNLLLVTSPAAWTPDGTGRQIVSCTRTSATQFTYARTGNPGSFTSATWNYALARGIAIRNGSVTSYACNVLNALVPTGGSFDCAGATDAAAASGDMHKTLCMCHHAAYGWTEPHGFAMAGWTFIACNRAVPLLAYTWLPSNTSVGETLKQEGMEYSITNGTPSSAAFGATITAGPPDNHYKVRWDGTNWIRVG